MSQKPIVIVGAGLGGLATALRLAHLGEKVLVLEKTHSVGGRNSSVQVNGCSFDGGPTLLMMLDPFRKLFQDVGERLECHLRLHLCDPSYRVFYTGGDRIDATTDRLLMEQRIRNLAGDRDAGRYQRFLEDLRRLYDDAIPLFVERNYGSVLDLASPRSLTTALRHGMLGNLAKRIDRTFDDPRLRMLFSFQTMYLGLSPYRAPWVYATLAYMECGEGIWYPEGGLAEISKVVARLAESKGAEIRLNTPVAEVKGNAVIMEDGSRIEAKAVVCNADLPYAQRALAKEPSRIDRRRYSCSAYMLYLDYEGAVPELLHHNVFFSKDFRGNLDSIFERHEVPKDPSFYACVSCRTEPANAPPGRENLYLLVPTPNLDHPWSEADANAVEDVVLGRLERETSFRRVRIVGRSTFSPHDWQSKFNLERGAAFGLSHDLLQSACFRPSNRSKHQPGLFYVGASTVPGNGLPMVLISADLVVQRMQQSGAI